MEFTKHPGQAPINVEENAVLIGGVPDWVNLPADLGGTRADVLDSFMGACPVTKAHVRHLVLEGGISVAESDQFYWYTTPEDQE